MNKIHPLRKWRKANGLRQNAFAKKVKISNSYLCDIERGLTEPSLAIAAKLAKFTGNQVSIADFVLPTRRSAA